MTILLTIKSLENNNKYSKSSIIAIFIILLNFSALTDTSVQLFMLSGSKFIPMALVRRLSPAIKFNALRCFSTSNSPQSVPKRRGRPPKNPASATIVGGSPVAPSTTHASAVWNWVPPSILLDSTAQSDDDEVIAVKKGILLTSEEIRDALIKVGGENVVVVPLREKIDTISELVLVSGRSARQIRKMATMIVQALKSRDLRQAMGFTGAEGEKEDDWLLVDCHNCVVHIMLPSTRTELDLETHWGQMNQAQRSAIGAEYLHDDK